MTDEIKTGGPAFPFVPGEGSALYESEGMQLRDYFAKEALGLCYAQYLNYAAVEGFQENWRTGVALDAYMMADAMIKARG
ncbi:hypothetical protein [Yersinia bercovieri]|uniref:hypothetical protein n=1 Tax=Yersinia bercovieri TaxID=634 RepID=UPI0011A7A57F|nr:hypothetical protein [Yersinia bercovieri]